MCTSNLDLNAVETLLLFVSTPDQDEVGRGDTDPQGVLTNFPPTPAEVTYRLLARPGWDSEDAIAIAADELKKLIEQMPRLGKFVLVVHVPGFVRRRKIRGDILESALEALAKSELELLRLISQSLGDRGIAVGVLVTEETAAAVNKVAPSGIRVFASAEEIAA